MDSVLWSKLFSISTKLSKNKWTSIHRETRDGFGANDFYRECYGVAITLTVVKTTNGNIFGCYTNLPWSSSFDIIDYIAITDSFLVWLMKKINHLLKCLKNKVVTFSFLSSWGPVFGNKSGNSDIYIASDSNMNTKSYSILGNGFERTGKSPDAEFL